MMRSSANKVQTAVDRGDRLVVGFGNPDRQDDGLGPYVADLVVRMISEAPGVRVLSCRQLTPDLIGDFAGAALAVLVDAGVNHIAGGWRLEKIRPDAGRVGHVTHACRPDYLAGLCRLVYGPVTDFRLLTVQGDAFGYGRGLSAASRFRAGEASKNLVKFLLQGGL